MSTLTALCAPASLLAHTGHGWGHAWVWAPFTLALWLALTATVVWLVTRSVGARRPSALDRAREVLAERYARGELTSDEYRERLAELRDA